MVVNQFPIRDGTGWRLVCIFWLLVATARAGVFYVSDTSDSLKPVSLRGAVIRGTQNGTNTIILANNPLSPGLHRKNIPRVYRLTRTSTNDLDGRMGNLVVNHGNLTIQGAGPGVVIDASQLHDRIFKVGPQATLRLINVTLTGGNPDGLFFNTNGPAGYVINNSPNAGLGGAICNQGNLFLADCLLTNNSSAFGGDPQSDSEGAGNPLSDGGALYNLGTAILVNCQLAGNKCGDGGLGGADGGNGGAIYNEFSGVCLLTDCQIVGNRAGDGAWASDRLIDGGWGGCGGGIFNDNGTLCLTNCSIVNNRAGRGMDGAAVVINGYVLVGSGGWGGDGGGICNINYGKLLSLKSCTVFSNVCGDGGNSAFTTNIANDSIAGDGGNGGSGGGISSFGQASFESCTFANNTAGNGGGGGNSSIPYVFGGELSGGFGGDGGSGGGLSLQDGPIFITSTTIVRNKSGAGGLAGNALAQYFSPDGPPPQGLNGGGGGICSSGYGPAGWVPPPPSLANCLIALNYTNATDGGITMLDYYHSASGLAFTIQTDGTGNDINGRVITRGFNLVGTGDGCAGLINGLNADLVGTDASLIDPQLGPLQFNGGLTPTMALRPGSPAIDQGNCFGMHTDQRGYYRPYVNKNIAKPSGGDGTDIGAYEFIPEK